VHINRVYKNYKNRSRLAKVIAKNKLSRFLWFSVYNRFTALWRRLPRWADTRRNIHPLTNSYHHPTFSISFFHLLRSISSSLFNYVLDNLFAQSLSKSSLVYFLVWSPHFFAQSVSSFRNTCPYHRSLFCCSTTIIPSIPRFLVSLCLNSLLGTLSFTLTSHIWPFSSLLAEVRPRFLSWQARSHFHVAYNFAHTMTK